MVGGASAWSQRDPPAIASGYSSAPSPPGLVRSPPVRQSLSRNLPPWVQKRNRILGFSTAGASPGIAFIIALRSLAEVAPGGLSPGATPPRRAKHNCGHHDLFATRGN